MISILASAIVDVVRSCKTDTPNTTDKYSEHNPKIGPITDLHLDDIVAISLLRREVATKNAENKNLV